MVCTIDLETEAHRGFYYGSNWETKIIKNTKYGRILSFSAKPLGEKGVVRGWMDYPQKNERSLVKDIWKVYSNFDILVGHNIKNFDHRWCITKFLQYNLPPPKPVTLFDTLTEFKRRTYLPSYSLDNIADYYGLGRKIHVEGHSLAERCVAGEKKAWNEMKRYNAQDTNLTEKIYLKILPYSLKSKEWVPARSCVACSSPKLVKRGFGYSKGKCYQILTCTLCRKRNRGMIISES